ncbi:MAG: hypothetical protein ACJ8AT_28355 [Hyalangium sp.]
MLLHALLLFGPTTQGAAPVKSEVLVCTQAVNGECKKNETAIPLGTDDIYATWVTNTPPKRGSTLVGTLIAEDVGAALPSGSRILDKEFKADVLNTLGGLAKHFTLKLHFNKPNPAWPAGWYRVEITQDGTLVGTGRYQVQGPKATVPLVQLGLCEQNPAKDCADVKTAFKTDTPALLAIARFSTPPKAGSKVTTKWIAVDVGKAAPPNTLIDQTVMDVTEQNRNVAKDHRFTVSGQLTRPTKGWPPGHYKVDWTLDGQPLGMSEFQVR